MNKKEQLRAQRMARNKKSFIFITILCMGVGFALLSSNLTITGNTNVSGNSWKVYFNSVSVTNGSVDATVAPEVSGTTTTSLDYTILLDKPGDFYEFTVEAKNDGTIDAAIDTLTTPNIASRVLQYLNYSVTYLDGSPVNEGDVLKKKTSTNYKVRVEYRTDIGASDLDAEGVNLDLSFGIDYEQYTPVASKFVKLVKASALSDTGLDFTQISSASNGRGLYKMSSTTNDAYPIYYYRGNVTNNNAKFAGFCWKIVRTTETGGTKLIYNGVPNGTTGECDATGASTQLTTASVFNTNIDSPAYNGYMYGTVYQSTNTTYDSSHVYGSAFTYENGSYTLTTTQSGVDATHHYTCFDSTGTCSNLRYVYLISETTAYYITLANGKSAEDALAEMKVNTTSSTIKTAVDNWFNNTFATYFTTNSKNYNDYVEDTVWCNDRSMNTIDITPDPWIGTSAINNGWNPNGGSTGNHLMYSSYGRIQAGTPSVICSNKNDSFSVNETLTGNGALTYPVGLLTAGEINLAGGQLYTIAENSDYYLYNEQSWWTMSPMGFFNSAYEYFVGPDGGVNYYYANYNEVGVRPSISLKPNVNIASGGDGTTESPYEFVVE